MLLLLLLFSAGVLAQQRVLPLIEGSDESLHYIYIEHLRAAGTLPDRHTRLTNPTRQESGQPPLTYLIGAALSEVLRLPRLDAPETLYAQLGKARNPWNTPGNIWNPIDNRNYYYSVGVPDERIVGAMMTLRLMSLGYGLLAVIGAYGAGWEIFRRREWALATAALFAFTPTFLHSTTYINNDVSATAFCTLALWGALRLLRLGASPSRLLLLGVLVAFAGLSKVNGLSAGAGVGVALLLDARRHGRLMLNGALFALPLALLFLPWVAYGMIHYGDPFGFNTHGDGGFFSPTMPPLTYLIGQLPNVFYSYWARFGLSIHLHPVFYALFAALMALALIGYVVGRRFGVNGAALVLGAAALVAGAGLVRWMQILPDIPARLLLPAHLAFAVGLAGGLYLLACRLPAAERALRLFPAGLLAGIALVISPVAVTDAFVVPPLTPREALPPLTGQPLDFGGVVRLLGYSPTPPRLTGDWYTMTLCWEILALPEREPAYSLKLIGADGVLTDRTTLFGLGRRTTMLWRPGDTFCDTLDLPLRDLPPAEAFDVVLVLLDAETVAAAWPATMPEGVQVDAPVLTQVYSPAGATASADNMQSLDVHFTGLADLSAYRLVGTPQPGAALTLELLWTVTGSTPEDWTQFVHLIGAEGGVTLADSRPRAGRYPTLAWASGERFTDSWTLTLPSDLPPGEYTLTTGLYRLSDGARLPLTQNGQPAPDHAARLATFAVEG